MKVFCFFLLVFVTVFSGASDCPAQKFESNGYEVELFWKVKGTRLKMWGDIERGRACERINVRAQLVNHRYERALYADLDAQVKRAHSPTSRSVFKGEDEIYNNRYKKGWHVYYLDVSCAHVNPGD